MVEENFLLKWKSHTDQLRQSLHQMMISESVTDVTLVSSDQLYFKAHKVVIGAGSSILNDIVNKTKVNDSFIFMRGVTGKDLKSILSFVYLGEVSIDRERMNEFLEIARDLGIKGLSVRESETNAKNHENLNRDTDVDVNEKMTENEHESFSYEVVKEEDIDEHFEEQVIRDSHDSNGEKGRAFSIYQIFMKGRIRIRDILRYIGFHIMENLAMENCDFCAFWKVEIVTDLRNVLNLVS